MYRAILGEQDLQVLARGYAVAKLKLNGLAFFNNIADRDCAGLLIRANQVPNEKVSSFKVISVLINDDTEVESQVCISPVSAS